MPSWWSFVAPSGYGFTANTAGDTWGLSHCKTLEPLMVGWFKQKLLMMDGWLVDSIMLNSWLIMIISGWWKSVMTTSFQWIGSTEKKKRWLPWLPSAKWKGGWVSHYAADKLACMGSLSIWPKKKDMRISGQLVNVPLQRMNSNHLQLSKLVPDVCSWSRKANFGQFTMEHWECRGEYITQHRINQCQPLYQQKGIANGLSPMKYTALEIRTIQIMFAAIDLACSRD